MRTIQNQGTISTTKSYQQFIKQQKYYSYSTGQKQRQSNFRQKTL